MNEKNDNCLKQYFKENLVVLVFELVIVLLLSCICTLMLGGKPAWLPPVLAVFAYLMAEMRFLMAYLASHAKKDPDTPAENAVDEDDLDMPQAFEEQDAQNDEDVLFVPPVLKHTDAPLEMPQENAPEAGAWAPMDELADEPIIVHEEVQIPREKDVLESAELGEFLFEEPDGEEDADFVPQLSGSAQPQQGDLPTQSVLDLGDEEDPFSH